MSKNYEKIKNPKISSCDKTYLYIKLTLFRSEINIFFFFLPQNFFLRKKIPKICQKWAKMSKNYEKIKNPKISSRDKTYLYIKLTVFRSEINIFFFFPPQNFFLRKKITKICQKWAKMSKKGQK
jgi:tryptophanyl-tRNA synthetase